MWIDRSEHDVTTNNMNIYTNTSASKNGNFAAQLKQIPKTYLLLHFYKPFMLINLEKKNSINQFSRTIVVVVVVIIVVILSHTIWKMDIEILV